MADTTRLPIKTAAAPSPAPGARHRDWPSFSDLRRDVDALFEDFGRNWLRVPARWRDFDPFGGLDLMPAMDVVENGTSYKLTAELPGMDEKSVEVTLAGDVLSVKGEKTETKEKDEKGRHVSERRYGSFERSITVPELVDKTKIEATYANGVLTVTLPKTEAAMAEPQKIEIKAA